MHELIIQLPALVRRPVDRLLILGAASGEVSLPSGLAAEVVVLPALEAASAEGGGAGVAAVPETERGFG
ncbi:MAG: hypothetical protein MI919_35185, partial [Holophagales bacterium]|nr:hypothetical protein [Holophagales bacterium]